MKAINKQVKDSLKIQGEKQMRLERAFIVKYVPRIHRLIMDQFPQLVSWFNYSIARNEKDFTKLTLIRGRKIIARNFDIEESI